MKLAFSPPRLAVLVIVLGLALLGAPSVLGGAHPYLSGYTPTRDGPGSGGGSVLLTVIAPARDGTSRGAGSIRLPVVTAAPTTVVPVPTPAPTPTAPPAPTTAPAPIAAPAGSDGATILDNPNNHPPPNLDPNRPYGPPVIRTDWVISKDYAAHGGNNPPPGNQWGAIDFAYWGNTGAFGSPIVATHAGKVHLLPDDPIYGNWVWVVNDHFTTRYGHTQKYLVQEGQMVVRGTVLAEMGSTGNSTGPHVDYQVWQDGANLNPMGFLK